MYHFSDFTAYYADHKSKMSAEDARRIGLEGVERRNAVLRIGRADRPSSYDDLIEKIHTAAFGHSVPCSEIDARGLVSRAISA